MDDKNMSENDKIVTEPSETDKKDFSEFMGRFLGWDSDCNNCMHRPVCSICEKEGFKKKEDCMYYKYNVSGRYGDIYEMFEPIFYWMNKNYPSDEMFFIVHRDQARMYLQHGPVVSSASLMSCIPPRFKTNKSDNDKKENENG